MSSASRAIELPPAAKARMEVASCPPEHEGESHGPWETCELVAEHREGTCDVRIASDGMLCRNVLR